MADLRASLTALAEAEGFSGVIALDGFDDDFTIARGLAHRGFEVPNQADTQFAVASAAKGFTALAVVSLIQEGLLAPATTARSLLGADLPLIADDVTVEHLLAHRSGIGDYIDEEDESLEMDDYVLATPVHRLVTTEAYLPDVDGHPTKFPAGERFSYCNGGYIVLALLAERASGVPFHTLVTDRVITPAGLSATGFLRSDEPSGRMANGYLYPDGLRTNVLHLPVLGNGDGGIYTTARDLVAFWAALFSGRIVGERWVEEMTTARSRFPGGGYGWGFWLDEEGAGVRLIGGDAGVSFTSRHDPATGSTWSVLSNTSDGAWPIIRHLRDTLGS
ncbi:MAG: beta-lactamase family protein [Acidimicrobiia bacterium]|nr:beta-lactamase family protein [Acidimicrobiia bacterium]